MSLARPIPLTAALALTVVGCGTDPLPYLGNDASTLDGGGDTASGGGSDAGVTPDGGGGGSSDASTGTDTISRPDTGTGSDTSTGSDTTTNPDTPISVDAGTGDGGTGVDGGGPTELPAAIARAIQSFCDENGACLVDAGYVPSERGCAEYLGRYTLLQLGYATTPGPDCYDAFVEQINCYNDAFNADCSYDEDVDCGRAEQALYAACGFEYEYDYGEEPIPPPFP